MAVLRPLKVVIDNYPQGKVEELEAINNPEDPAAGSRRIPFSREIYIEKEDFREDPPSKYFRLAPGREVRLKHAYFIKCERAVKDQNTGEITQLHCTYDPATKSGEAGDGRKVKGTLHWVSAAHSRSAEVRLYDHLFSKANPSEDDDFRDSLNPHSLETLTDCRVEPSLKAARPGYRCQFLRQGYFCLDPDSREGRLVFNRTVGLRDSWARIEKAQKKS
jgi:glutaminyl-tRNA synthetase